MQTALGLSQARMRRHAEVARENNPVRANCWCILRLFRDQPAIPRLALQADEFLSGSYVSFCLPCVCRTVSCKDQHGEKNKQLLLVIVLRKLLRILIFILPFLSMLLVFLLPRLLLLLLLPLPILLLLLLRPLLLPPRRPQLHSTATAAATTVTTAATTTTTATTTTAIATATSTTTTHHYYHLLLSVLPVPLATATAANS